MQTSLLLFAILWYVASGKEDHTVKKTQVEIMVNVCGTIEGGYATQPPQPPVCTFPKPRPTRKVRVSLWQPKLTYARTEGALCYRKSVEVCASSTWFVQTFTVGQPYRDSSTPEECREALHRRSWRGIGLTQTSDLNWRSPLPAEPTGFAFSLWSRGDCITHTAFFMEKGEVLKTSDGEIVSSMALPSYCDQRLNICETPRGTLVYEDLPTLEECSFRLVGEYEGIASSDGVVIQTIQQSLVFDRNGTLSQFTLCDNSSSVALPTSTGLVVVLKSIVSMEEFDSSLDQAQVNQTQQERVFSRVSRHTDKLFAHDLQELQARIPERLFGVPDMQHIPRFQLHPNIDARVTRVMKQWNVTKEDARRQLAYYEIPIHSGGIRVALLRSIRFAEFAVAAAHECLSVWPPLELCKIIADALAVASYKGQEIHKRLRNVTEDDLDAFHRIPADSVLTMSQAIRDGMLSTFDADLNREFPPYGRRAHPLPLSATRGVRAVFWAETAAERTADMLRDDDVVVEQSAQQDFHVYLSHKAAEHQRQNDRIQTAGLTQYAWDMQQQQQNEEYGSILYRLCLEEQRQIRVQLFALRTDPTYGLRVALGRDDVKGWWRGDVLQVKTCERCAAMVYLDHRLPGNTTTCYRWPPAAVDVGGKTFHYFVLPGTRDVTDVSEVVSCAEVPHSIIRDDDGALVSADGGIAVGRIESQAQGQVLERREHFQAKPLFREPGLDRPTPMAPFVTARLNDLSRWSQRVNRDLAMHTEIVSLSNLDGLHLDVPGAAEDVREVMGNFFAKKDELMENVKERLQDPFGIFSTLKKIAIGVAIVALSIAFAVIFVKLCLVRCLVATLPTAVIGVAGNLAQLGERAVRSVAGSLHDLTNNGLKAATNSMLNVTKQQLKKMGNGAKTLATRALSVNSVHAVGHSQEQTELEPLHVKFAATGRAGPPHVLVTLNGAVVNAMLDTGAARSVAMNCLRETVVFNSIRPSTSADIDIAAANGQGLVVDGVADATVALGEMQMRHTFLLSSDITSAQLLLGDDFFTAMRTIIQPVHIDYIGESLVVGSQSIPFTRQ